MRSILLFTSLVVSSSVLANSDDAYFARSTVKAFSTDLKNVLVSTMKASGPVAAIAVCNISAPAIALQHSANEWEISRTSLKVRNPNNQANEWLNSILLDFEQRKENGEPIANIEHQEQKADAWYLVKAIPTGQACLACHGSELKPEVKNKLTELYPSDKATGFNLGDIRGAFVVKKHP
ncbi:DUF3365 domain-containing protein [Pseudoalteromonas nigrifaciens]|uniref:Tll0287-like domain-containing protein n=2 Tax=Gammaproteobacteria TaxID=1236 RepID=UPI0030CA1FB7